MIGTGAHIAVSAIDRTCKELSVPLPKGYLDRLAAADKLTTNLAKFSGPNAAGSLVDAVFDVVARGGNPADDENVRRWALVAQLEGYELSRQAHERSKAMVGDAVCEYADQLITSWSEATNTEGEALREVAQHPTFHGVDNVQAMSPAQLVDPADHKRWVTAATAGRKLDSAANGFGSLLAAVHLGHPPGYRTLVLGPDMRLDDLAEVNRANGNPTAWTIASAGITPTLCRSLADFAQAVGAVSAEQSARDEDALAASTPTRVS